MLKNTSIRDSYGVPSAGSRLDSGHDDLVVTPVMAPLTIRVTSDAMLSYPPLPVVPVCTMYVASIHASVRGLTLPLVLL